MTDNRTTELLQELRDLAADVNPSEIIDHVSITRMGWTFDAQWLDAWHMEFDRIMQAIAATLGNGTLTAEQVSEAIYAHSIHADCADADWQAIADELNAELGSWTCRDASANPLRFECSECGGLSIGIVQRFCPCCGREVVDEC